jgi:signal transduction histidine kinase
VPAERLLADVVEAEAMAAPPEEVLLAWDAPPGLAIRCDYEQMHRVLTNLVRNARQAIQAQARLTGEPGEVRITAAEAADAWCLRIRDTGPGLPERAKEHLFSPFRGTARKGGTGLGLAIAAELVRGHGGRLELERSDAEGTVFRIELPRDIGEASAPQTSADAA